MTTAERTSPSAAAKRPPSGASALEADCFMALMSSAATSTGEMAVRSAGHGSTTSRAPPMRTGTSRAARAWSSSAEAVRPISRLHDAYVEALSVVWRATAASPTSTPHGWRPPPARSGGGAPAAAARSASRNVTTEGKIGVLYLVGSTRGDVSPSTSTATAQLVVPRSMPTRAVFVASPSLSDDDEGGAFFVVFLGANSRLRWEKRAERADGSFALAAGGARAAAARFFSANFCHSKVKSSSSRRNSFSRSTTRAAAASTSSLSSFFALPPRRFFGSALSTEAQPVR